MPFQEVILRAMAHWGSRSVRKLRVFVRRGRMESQRTKGEVEGFGV